MAQTILKQGATIRWHPQRAERVVKKQMERKFKIAGVKIENQVKKNISTSTAAHGPSKPGEFPHLDTGRLRASIFHDVFWEGSVLLCRVGTPLDYGLILEYNGRSFLRRTLTEMWPALRAEFGRG